jgi:hypothetical protein
VRQLRRQTGFTLTIVVTLGLAIGANTAILSSVNALLIQPFPYRDPGLCEVAVGEGLQVMNPIQGP